jgi:hypothetical protein
LAERSVVFGSAEANFSSGLSMTPMTWQGTVLVKIE